ncbi:MAG: putative sulfate exporter family transporter [bacterium]
MKQMNWSGLYKKEDWLTVWAALIIILIILTGITVKMPALKWTTGSEFERFCIKMAPKIDKLEIAAEEKSETDLSLSILELKNAIASNDRKGVVTACQKMGATAMEVEDASLYKSSAKLSREIGSEAKNTPGKVIQPANLLWILFLCLVMLILSAVAFTLTGNRYLEIIRGFPVVFILALVAQFIAGNYTMLNFGMEYVIWALILGLIISNIFGVPDWLRPAIRTEFYIKTGVVILGTGILFNEIVTAGVYGIIQALLVVFVVWYSCFWIARKLKVDDDFAAILSSAVSICGVSAAIATAGAIKGDPKKLSYTTSIVLICAVPMLILQPIIAKWLALPDLVAGAWLGGTLDTSGSVVAAGSLISETAMKTGVIVKMSQNVLIGVAAFILSIVWAMKSKPNQEGTPEKTGILEIWYRFPKFVLGFIATSLLFSFLVDPKLVETTKPALTGIRNWWFALAFVSIGLETRFSELAKMGKGRPALAFVSAQVFNLFWTLLLAWLIFGGVLFPVPALN